MHIRARIKNSELKDYTKWVNKSLSWGQARSHIGRERVNRNNRKNIGKTQLNKKNNN